MSRVEPGLIALFGDCVGLRSGETHSADGPFRMLAENGGLLELLEPFSEWTLLVEHSCSLNGSSLSQKFAFVGKPLDGEVVKLEPVS